MSRVESQEELKQVVRVLLPLPLNEAYDYKAPVDVNVGDIVTVSFGQRHLEGVVWAQSPSPHDKPLKEISHQWPMQLPEVSRRFIEWVSRYTMSERGRILKMALSVPDVFTEKKRPRRSLSSISDAYDYSPPLLNEDQEKAAEHLKEKIKTHGFSVVVLDGVTGSGKTEVYFEAIAETIAQGLQVLILLPEIALSPQWLSRFQGRFGQEPLVWHSNRTLAQRRLIWQRILENKPIVVVGARSALFLPFQNLGLIIVDEEHEHSYKQEEGVIYHARDMAVVRGSLGKIPVILASATPSLETIENYNSGRYEWVTLPCRHGRAQLPSIEALDLRVEGVKPQKGRWLSPFLMDEINKTLSRGEQVLLFLNRRGYAPITLCGACGYRLMCPQCSTALVEHRRLGALRCHQCGYGMPIPCHCPHCQEKESLVPCGPGVERVFEEIQACIPTARTELMSSDVLETADHLRDSLERIHARQVDIIVGTQIMAKGHHFPYLTLVGVVDADIGLYGGDLRAGEKTYQLLHQVAGRAGREEKKGRVLLQTYQPDHPVMQAIITQDRETFLQLERDNRSILEMPPFGRLIAIIMSGLRENEVRTVAQHLSQALNQVKDIEIFGPIPAPIAVIRRRYRWRLLLKGTKEKPLQAQLTSALNKIRIPRSVRIQIDVDPYSFL